MMKTRWIFGLLLLVATLCGCSKDQPLETNEPRTDDQGSIRASMDESTRTFLDGSAIKWKIGDKILLVQQSNTAITAEYTLASGENTTDAVFVGAKLTGPFYALYPYSSTANCANGQMNFTLPAAYSYDNAFAANTFANGMNPMIAQSDANGTLQFKNLCGAIKIQLTGSQTISKISLATMGEKIAGDAYTQAGYTGAPSLFVHGNMTMNYLDMNDLNVTLTDQPTSIYFVVPAGIYKSGLNFTVYDNAGKIIRKLTTKFLTVTRSKVLDMGIPPVGNNFPDAAFRTYLEGKGFKLNATKTDIDPADPVNQALFLTTTDINVSGTTIASLKGLEYFTELISLDCSGLYLPSLNVTQCPKLISLHCKNNWLTDLNVNQCPKLTTLFCYANRLETLDIRDNPLMANTLQCGEQMKTLTLLLTQTQFNAGCGASTTPHNTDVNRKTES
ncbi:MAG: hypothetical protein RRY73_05545 [Alistipes sp.]